MVEDYCLVLKQQQFDMLQEFEDMRMVPKFHIYMILKRPRIFFDKNTLKFNGTSIIGNCKLQKRDEYEIIPFKFDHEIHFPLLKKLFRYNMEDFEVTCEYPYEVISLINKKTKKVHAKALASILLQEYGDLHKTYIDKSEVLYIGKSYGDHGDRTAHTRLESHKTLQKIYSDSNPDEEILLALFSFNRNEIMCLSPIQSMKSNVKVYSHYMDKVLNKGLMNEEQEINFTEAALIRYFQPFYNDKFKYRFPSKDHSTYDQCFKLNLDYISVEIDTKRLNMKLWSNSQPEKFDHTIFYSLKDEKAYKDLFHFTGDFFDF